ncbi:Creatinase aminopeptidase [Amanita rubescens]|nr:Creatinase aminopeptidase [Amanita rubescens]KAF8321514.1 Creatinase aminopeptidase [Amanita rubescens]
MPPPPPPPPICLPFIGKKKKQPRRLSGSSFTDTNEKGSNEKTTFMDKITRRPSYSPTSTLTSVAASLEFHSDSEHYDDAHSTLPEVYHDKNGKPKLLRSNTMTGTKRSNGSGKTGYGWGAGKKQKEVEAELDLLKRSESPSETPLPVYQPARSPPVRSDSRVTQSSKSSRRTQDSQRTQSSQRTYTTHRSKDTYQSGASGSTMPKPRRPLLSSDSVDTLVGSGFMRKESYEDPPQERVDTTERLEALRNEMAKHELDFYIIPSEDAHGSEYVAASDKRREFISGFTGSAGDTIISKSAAYLVTDARYWGQAERELDPLWTLVQAGSSNGPKDWIEWLLGRVKGVRIGIDARMLSHEKSLVINAKISSLDSKMVYPPQNLVDLIWKNKPPKSKAPVFKQEIEYTGQDTRQKLEKIRNWIREQRPSQPSYAKGPPTQAQKHIGTLISFLPCIAWVLNLRGQDIPYNPLFHAYLYVGLDQAVVFLDGSKVDESVAGYLREVGIDRREFIDVWTFLRKREWGEGKILLPPHTSYAISLMITQLRYTIAPAYVEHLMAVKNKVEIDGLRRAYLRDGAAFVQFLAWLEGKLQEGYDITEWEAANRLTEFRRKKKNFMGLAYENLSASGPNAALPHYSPLKSAARMIDRESPYLNDSGGQYRDGTCDTTRTVHFGRPSSEQCEAYTKVLQGHIAIDTAVFPEGTSGYQLDVLARKALWKDGMNYMHGTGHGFGSFLTVHEGPHGFSSHVPLVPGHVVTNEPGYYKAGAWGMRIESALLVTRVKTKHSNGDVWHGFERLTCVPIQTRMVKDTMLTKEEKAWIKEHNQRCYEKLAAQLKDDKRALKWMKREAERGIGLASGPPGIDIDWD